MSRGTQQSLGIVAIVIVGLVLVPIFSRGEPGLLLLLLLFLAGGAFLVRSALRSQARPARYALLGVIPGFFLGGLGVGLLSWTAGWGAEGWEDVSAVAAGIMGAFGGAIAGAFVGGLWGRRVDQHRGETNRS